MAQDRFYVGPFEAGQQTNKKPFAIADTAYEQLRNAYAYRGRIRKRFGTRPYEPGTDSFAGAEQLQSRLRHALGATDGAGNFAGFVPRTGVVPNVTPAVGQMFSIEGDFFTVTVVGAPANLLRSDGLAAVATFNNADGAVTINSNGHLNKEVYYYPALPVMGFSEFELDTINNEQTIAFDTRYAYAVNNLGWTRVGLETDIWSGGNADFFWSSTWRGALPSDNALFVTNNILADGMKYWNSLVWTLFAPLYTAALTIETARIIVPFKGRLLLLNTTEDGVVHSNRCRFSWRGNPFHADAFRDDLVNRGGWEEIPVQEAIITVQNLRDRLIVYCERSTWELVPTGADIRPFVFQQINTELGAESTFSQIPFDQAVLGVGNVGIHACDGNSVKRIDNEIPNDVFSIHNENDGPRRVCGIRDYYTEMAYWTFPSMGRTTDFPYPDRVLLFNYSNGSWAYNDDSFTTFGYIQNAVVGSAVWSVDSGLWQDDFSTWEDPNIMALARNVIAGNQQGYVFILDATVTRNASGLQITQVTAGPACIITAIDHNLKNEEFVLIENCVGATELNHLIFQVNVIDRNNFSIGPVSFTAYLGGGTVARVSRVDILSKRYNFYGDKGSNMALSKVDFLVDKTTTGEITFNYRVSNSRTDMQEKALASGALLGSSVLKTMPYTLVTAEQSQEQFWHAMYPQAQGEFVQIHLYFDEVQMAKYQDDADGNRSFTAHNDFQLHNVLYLTSPLSRF